MIIKQEIQTPHGVRFYKMPGESKLRSYSFPENMFSYIISIVREDNVDNFLIETPNNLIKIPIGNIITFNEIEQGRKFIVVRYDNGAFYKIPTWNTSFALSQKSMIEFNPENQSTQIRIQEKARSVQEPNVHRNKNMDGLLDKLMQERAPRKSFDGLLDKLMKKE